MRLLILWIINAASLLIVAHLMPSIHVSGFATALIAALLLGFVNTIMRPLLIFLTLPVTLLTLGLFIFVINGALFWFVGSYLDGFIVNGFWSGFWGAIVYSLVSWSLSAILLPARVSK
jgi:putative membrane protein